MKTEERLNNDSIYRVIAIVSHHYKITLNKLRLMKYSEVLEHYKIIEWVSNQVKSNIKNEIQDRI